MNNSDLRARVARLDRLSRGVALELALLGDADDPLLYRERLEYRQALHRARSGFEAARVALAHALHRMQEAPPRHTHGP